LIPLLFLLLREGARADDPAEGEAARLTSYIRELEKPRASQEGDGLRVSAALVPDVLAFEVGRRYLAARGEGKAHEASLEAAASGIKRIEGVSSLRQLDGKAGLFVTLENLGHGGGSNTQVFTIQETIPGGVVRLLGFAAQDGAERKGPGKRIPLKGLGKPEKLRPASLRISKFYKRSEKDPRNRESDFEPIISKPTRALVLEEGPARLPFLFSPEALRQQQGFDLEVRGLKRYRGPFEKDLLDLNQRRVWEPIRPLRVQLPLPPEGLDRPPELKKLVADALLR
jgi:hypothetical protein